MPKTIAEWWECYKAKPKPVGRPFFERLRLKHTFKPDQPRDSDGRFSAGGSAEGKPDDQPKAPAIPVAPDPATPEILATIDRGPAPIADTEENRAPHRRSIVVNFEESISRSMYAFGPDAVSNEIAGKIESSAREMFTKMPAEAIKRLDEHLHGFSVYPNTGRLTVENCDPDSKGLYHVIGGLAAQAVPTGVIGGPTKSGIYVDGGTNTKDKYSNDTSDAYLAHECGHVVDWSYGNGKDRDSRLSTTPEWRSIWNEEINKDGNPLTSYARTNQGEGFAEFSRMVWANDKSVAAKQFPKAMAFFEERGLA